MINKIGQSVNNPLIIVHTRNYVYTYGDFKECDFNSILPISGPDGTFSGGQEESSVEKSDDRIPYGSEVNIIFCMLH